MNAEGQARLAVLLQGLQEHRLTVDATSGSSTAGARATLTAIEKYAAELIELAPDIVV